MQVQSVSITRSDKPQVLAAATVVLSDNSGDTITIEDIRVLLNKSGQEWVALPNRPVQTPGHARQFTYLPIVSCSRELVRRIETEVLKYYDQWATTQKSEVR